MIDGKVAIIGTGFMGHTHLEALRRIGVDVAGVMGSLQALEVLKELLGIGNSMAGKMMVFDALSGHQRVISLPADPDCLACGPKPAKIHETSLDELVANKGAD